MLSSPLFFSPHHRDQKPYPAHEHRAYYRDNLRDSSSPTHNKVTSRVPDPRPPTPGPPPRPPPIPPKPPVPTPPPSPRSSLDVAWGQLARQVIRLLSQGEPVTWPYPPRPPTPPGPRPGPRGPQPDVPTPPPSPRWATSAELDSQLARDDGTLFCRPSGQHDHRGHPLSTKTEHDFGENGIARFDGSGRSN
ncbi:hypothetical protein F4778DRAFT_577651 [Xylariomycetidae sp. FL2044]|nr:hypothetical protein F4778DRAFT_577651 [Xylariomycetidae sp. FL2044]